MFRQKLFTLPSSAAFAALAVVALSAVPALAASVTVKALRLGEHKDKTRLVLDLSGPTEARTSVAPDGRTLFVDLPGAGWGAAAKKTFGASPNISGYEIAALPDGGSRLTISGKQPIMVKEMQKVSPGEGYGHRLVFDVAAGAAPLAVQPAPMMMTPVAAPVAAVDPGAAPGPYLAPHIGTLGVGADLGYRINEMVGVRATGNYFKMNRDSNIDGVDYKGDATLKNIGALADIYPFGGGFHLTGGAYVNMAEGKLSATPTASTTIGDNTYTPSQIGTLNSQVDFNRFAPYLGMGWKGSVLHPNLMVGADLGVIYQGSPRVSLSSSGGLSSAAYQADLERERKNIEDELSSFRFYPVATVSVGYKF